MRRLVQFTAICVISILLQACQMSPQATGTKTATTEHIAGAPVSVESRNGSIEVSADSSAGSDVQIDAKITCSGDTQAQADQRLADATVSVSRRTDRTLMIAPVFPGGPRDNDGAAFTIRLPDAQGVNVTTSNGRVRITGLGGAAVIHTSNGSVTVIDHNGPANIESSNGGVTVQRLGGELVVRTSNGAVEVTDVAGPARIRSSNGSIRLALNPDQPGPIDLHTSNGSVKAKVGPAFAGIVRMDTSNGSIKVNDQARRVKAQSIDKSDGTVVVGEGGVESTISTSNGRIELEIGG